MRSATPTDVQIDCHWIKLMFVSPGQKLSKSKAAEIRQDIYENLAYGHECPHGGYHRSCYQHTHKQKIDVSGLSGPMTLDLPKVLTFEKLLIFYLIKYSTYRNCYVNKRCLLLR